jgi:hypothetical protein
MLQMSHGKAGSVCCQLNKNVLLSKIILHCTYILSITGKNKTALLFKGYITPAHTFCLLQRIKAPFSKPGCFRTGLVKLQLVLIDSKIHNPESKQTERVTAIASFHLVTD